MTTSHSASLEPQDQTVLVLEPDDAMRQRAIGMLQKLGYRVLACADGETAWRILQEEAFVDVVFSEVVTPEPLLAVTLCERALALDEDVEILFTSACPDTILFERGYLRDKVDLLRKPYDAKELDARIRHLLGNRLQRRWLHRYLAKPAVSAPAAAAASDVLRILLVEDSEDTLHATTDLLEMLGHAVSPVASAEAALALLDTNTFDVLCSDVTLPGLSGIELGRRVRDAHPAMHIIFASGHGARMGPAGDSLDAIILPKPYGIEALEGALRQVLANRAWAA